MSPIPDSATVMVTSSVPEHLNVLNQGEHAWGTFNIYGFGIFSFSVRGFGTPRAPILISTEDQREVLVSTHFGSNPDLIEQPKSRFILKCFLTAWTAKRGHPSGYLDKPVPFPLPLDLRQEVGSPEVPKE